MTILDIDCVSQSFDRNLTNSTIHCGKDQDCNIYCSQDASCLEATFYIYQYPTTIYCNYTYSCYQLTIISKNTPSLRLIANSLGSFYRGYLSIDNSDNSNGNISIQCTDKNGLFSIVCITYLTNTCLYDYIICP